MTWFIVALISLGVFFTIGCAVYGMIKLKSNPLEIYVRYTLFAASGVVAANVIAMLVPNEFLSLTFFGIYNIVETLATLLILRFTRRYLAISQKLGGVKKFINALAIFDSVLMLVNPFFGFLYKVEIVTDNVGNRFYRCCDVTPFYYFHATLVTMLLCAVLLMLLHRIITAPRAYSIKYSSLFISLLSIALFGSFYTFLNFKYDYSLMIYSVVGFCIFYFSLIYVPRGLMERLLMLCVSSIRDGIVCLDIDGKIAYANKAAEDFCEADYDIGNLDVQVRKWMHEYIPKESDHVWETTRKIDGVKRYFTIEYHRIYDKEYKYLGCFFLVHDRSDEYMRYYAEKFKSSHDQLTGLYNKECFFESVRKFLDDNPDKKFYIIVTDVKNFKIVNDVFGVEAGDRLLKRISETTAEYGGRHSIYGRLSGDRFAICIPKHLFSEQDILKTYSALESFFDNAGFKIHIHIGVFEVTDRTLRVSVMCDRANLAIKTIKDSYRSFVAYYDNQLRESFLSEHKLVSEFEKAITSGQFKPYIQPQIARNGNIMGGEMLVRWIHPSEGEIPPGKFINSLESMGLICRLDRYMWEKAFQILKEWDQKGFRKDSYISVNISAKDFYMFNIFNEFFSLCQKYSIESRRVHLEITETTLMDRPEEQFNLIKRLRGCGFIVEIDDFGSGYSSLNMLKNFDVDVLKIDMCFLKKSENEAKSRTILRKIIELAKSLDMEVITEGVETKQQVKFLLECGCDVFQGYYFSKPVSVHMFEEKYLNKRFRLSNNNKQQK